MKRPSLDLLRLALFFLAALAASGAPAAEPSAAQQQMQQQLQRIRDLRVQRPGDGLLVYYEAATQASMGQADAAVATLKQLSGRRLGLLPAKAEGFEPIWDHADFQAIRVSLAQEERATAAAPVSFRLNDARLIPEGIAYDRKRRVHYVSSIAQRKIVAIDARGRVRDFSSAADGLQAVLGLAVDPTRDRLCAVSTNGFLQAAQQQRRNEVVCWSLGTARVVQRIEAPDAMQLNDLAFARDGGLYVSDSAAGSLWMAGRDEPRLRLVGAARSMPGANGVAVAPDGTVYVALSTGIARVAPAGGESTRLPQPDDVATGGIDGLYWNEGGLVGVQNGGNPGRVLRITLAAGGHRIRGVTVLQSHHHPDFAEPTTGVIVGAALHVIANSHVAAYQPDGTIEQPEALRPTAIVAVPLRR